MSSEVGTCSPGSALRRLSSLSGRKRERHRSNSYRLRLDLLRSGLRIKLALVERHAHVQPYLCPHGVNAVLDQPG